MILPTSKQCEELLDALLKADLECTTLSLDKPNNPSEVLKQQNKIMEDAILEWFKTVVQPETRVAPPVGPDESEHTTNVYRGIYTDIIGLDPVLDPNELKLSLTDNLVSGMVGMTIEEVSEHIRFEFLEQHHE